MGRKRLVSIHLVSTLAVFGHKQPYNFQTRAGRPYLKWTFYVIICREIMRPEREQAMVDQIPDTRYQTYALKSGGSFARLAITIRNASLTFHERLRLAFSFSPSQPLSCLQVVSKSLFCVVI